MLGRSAIAHGHLRLYILESIHKVFVLPVLALNIPHKMNDDNLENIKRHREVICRFLSNSAISTIPPSEVILPPSKLAITFLAFTFPKLNWLGTHSVELRGIDLNRCNACYYYILAEVKLHFSAFCEKGGRNLQFFHRTFIAL